MKEAISTLNAPQVIGPYSQAILSSGLIFVSGQLGIDPATGLLKDGVESQAHQSMKNLGAILDQKGLVYENVVKTTIFVSNLDDFTTINKIYEGYFKASFPARSCVQVSKLPLDALVEIECIATI